MFLHKYKWGHTPGPHTWWLKYFSTFHHPSWQAVKCSVADSSLVSIQSCDLDVFIVCKCIISWSYWADVVPIRSSRLVSETWGLTKSQVKKEDWMRMLELGCISCLLNYFTHNLWSKAKSGATSDTLSLRHCSTHVTHLTQSCTPSQFGAQGGVIFLLLPYTLHEILLSADVASLMPNSN